MRYNPDGDAEMNERQTERLKRLVRLAPRERPQVPLRAARAGRGGPARAGGRRHRPLRRRAAPRADAAHDRELQDAGVEADIWKIEGIDTQEDCERIAADRPPRGPRRRDLRGARPRRERREGRALAAPGRAGRGLRGLRDRPHDLVGRAQGLPRRRIEREDAAQQIADNYLRFVRVYDEAARAPHGQR